MRVMQYPSCCALYIVKDLPSAHGVTGLVRDIEAQFNRFKASYPRMMVTINSRQHRRFRKMLEERLEFKLINTFREGLAPIYTYFWER